MKYTYYPATKKKTISGTQLEFTVDGKVYEIIENTRYKCDIFRNRRYLHVYLPDGEDVRFQLVNGDWQETVKEEKVTQ
ncbi:MAG: hypothetical protein ISR78_04675 [Spirochaetia bacterium]|nr:hypothetical protein [Spirochaetia bacterium]